MSGQAGGRRDPRPGRGRAVHAAGVLGTALAAAGAARVGYAALTRRPPHGAATWGRTNHRGEPVTLLEGPAVAAAGVAATLAAFGLTPRERVAVAVAGTGGGLFGCYDDLAGSADRRGFRGHLAALARGQVSSGVVKLAGIGATGVVAAATLGGAPVDVAINASLIGGMANLVNLFDLRPGRAVKAACAIAGLLCARSPEAVAGPLAAAVALLPEDLGERAMLGDAGANAVGAMLGAAVAVGATRRRRVTVLAGVTALTAVSEAVSFTRVIERTPPLRWLDMLGRRRADGGASGRCPRPVAAPPQGQGTAPRPVPADRDRATADRLAGRVDAGVP